MNLIQRIRQRYRRGYDLAREIDELVCLYGKDNFVKGNVDAPDKGRLETITHELRILHGPPPNTTSLYMACGFLNYVVTHRQKRSIFGKVGCNKP